MSDLSKRHFHPALCPSCHCRTRLNQHPDHAFPHPNETYVCLGVHACVCLCAYVYMCVSVCVCVHIYICTHVCMYVCMYVCMHVCTHVCIPACMWVASAQLCSYISTCVLYLCTYVCVYTIHEQTYMCAYITFIHTYIQTDRKTNRQTDRQTNIFFRTQRTGSRLASEGRAYCSGTSMGAHLCAPSQLHGHVWLHALICTATVVTHRECLRPELAGTREGMHWQ